MSLPLLLLVEDEVSIQRATSAMLRSRGYAVSVAGTGGDAIDALDRERPALVILDLGLPDIDGVTVCREIRHRSDLPILVLSVRGDERSKVSALDAGADDYVTKPFGPEELMARIRAGLRRAGGEPEMHGRIEHGGLALDFDCRRVLMGREEVALTPKEFELLALLIAHGGCVLTHRAIAKRLWGGHGGGRQEHLRVLVNQLRKKIERDPSQPRYVITEPWVGYRFGGDEIDATP